MGPLALRKIAAGAKTEGGDQFLFVNKSELDLAASAATGQPPVPQHRQGPDRTAVREDHRLARLLLGPELDVAVLAEAVRNEWAGAMVSASRAHARVGREIGLYPSKRLLAGRHCRLAKPG
jgi:hypothetical protein